MSFQANILIVDDEQLFAETVADKVVSLGHTATCAFSLSEGLAQAAKGNFDLILLDIHLPDGNGLEAIDRLRAMPSEPQVIIITGDSDPDAAELAIRYGAWCYLGKASILRQLVLPLTRALEYRKALDERQRIVDELDRKGLVGNSPLFRRSLEQLAQAASSSADILITGESGTGKELFARALHANSSQRKGNFVVVDCAALPENLVESVLFGHVKGAFTGADHETHGLIRYADHGTLFLDEVGELPLSVQKVFLRVLQERTFRPVGGVEELASEFRLVCATNRDLESMVADNLFRADLFHRLQGMILHLPPLRQRQEDIPLLVDFYLRELSSRYGQPIKQYDQDFMDCLLDYDWPGNIRELFQALESALAEGFHHPCLFVQHLPVHVRAAHARARAGLHEEAEIMTDSSSPLQTWREARDAFEYQYLRRLLETAAGNKSKAAALSGLSRNRLYQLLAKHDLS